MNKNTNPQYTTKDSYCKANGFFYPAGSLVIPPKNKLNINMDEVNRIQKERNEMLINHFPIAAKQWGLTK